VFNLQGSEIIVILLLALVILGPEKLPDAVRKFAQTYGELKKMGSGFQSELKSVLDEPVREMKETARLVRDAADPQKIAEQAAEDGALREAAQSADRAAITDVPITDAALESTDPAYNGAASAGESQPAPHDESTTGGPTAGHHVSSHDDPEDWPPAVINQIAAANARGPIEPVIPEALTDEVDHAIDDADQPVIAVDVVADADVTAG
jgi:sec-independent protein translocase protein TatB